MNIASGALIAETGIPASLQAERQELQALVDIAAQTVDRKSTRLNSSHIQKSRMPSSA